MRLTLTSLFIFFTCLIAVGQHSYLSILDDKSIRFDTTYWVSVSNILAFDTLYAWQEWQIAENYNFGKNRGDLQMITDLQALHPYFRDKIIQLIENCKQKGIQLSVVESYRTRAKQAEYFGMGKKYTRSTGGKSKHQYGLACDVVPIVNDSATWEDKILWKKIGVEGEKLGLRWGGRWRNPFDPAHFEWTGGLTTAQLSAGIFPTPNVALYPCLNEDIKVLRKFWEAWETEQAINSRPIKNKSFTNALKP